MTPLAEESSGPLLANVVVVLGFVVIFTTFVTGSPFSWIIGGLMVLGGGLWAGLAGTDPEHAEVDSHEETGHVRTH